jgi:hypothetical protein
MPSSSSPTCTTGYRRRNIGRGGASGDTGGRGLAAIRSGTTLSGRRGACGRRGEGRCRRPRHSTGREVRVVRKEKEELTVF